ncbi:MAG: hypothetical protein JEZ06_22040 [Anaerolineaceae bacterium]|nr:hypothetical protein [Anaerolineaceae bacterium]
MDIKRVSMSYLVRIWQEDPSVPWQFWVKTLANNKEHTFSTAESFHEFFESELFAQNQDAETDSKTNHL